MKIIITGTLEKFGNGDSHTNATRNHNMCRHLCQSGLDFVSATGSYRGVHQGESFVVDCPHPANVSAVLFLARMFGQESVIIDGAVRFVTGPRAGEVVEPVRTLTGCAARAMPFFTRFSTGECVSYIYPTGTFAE